MRSHLHFDQSKDLWSVELKIPRQMAPVTLGFVLWNSGKTTGSCASCSLPCGVLTRLSFCFMPCALCSIFNNLHMNHH